MTKNQDVTEGLLSTLRRFLPEALMNGMAK